jgi:LytS/YehU family sensor histidine kinase
MQVGDIVVQYVIYCAIVLAVYAGLSYRAARQRELRASQLEALLAQTRLQMLSMQLQPHFLFNTLNTIAELVHQQPDAAERMIGDLSHLLRSSACRCRRNCRCSIATSTSSARGLVSACA